MIFTSDNASGTHPNVMSALSAANEGHFSSYGADPIMDEVRAQIRDLFEAPHAEVHLVATGTAANSLILGTLVAPYQTIYAAPNSHIQVDECNAPEFYAGGAKITLIGDEDKIAPPALEAKMAHLSTFGVHGPQHGALSITQVTEFGQLYTLDHIQSLCDIAHRYGARTHLDGARFANAIAALGCSAADMTWKSGIDSVSFGGTKNGLMGVEACVFFDAEAAASFEFRRKRGAHLFSKHRYLSAQMNAYLTGDLWHELATHSNAMGARLAAGLAQKSDVKILNAVEANMIFVSMPRRLHQELHAGGAQYYLMHDDVDHGPADEWITGRLVTSWCTQESDVDRFLALIG